jgi:hypothetical protein
MNKVKTLKAITVAASIALAMSFTLGCSDDKDSSSGDKYCKLTSGSYVDCIEIGDGEEQMTKEICESGAAVMPNMYSLTNKCTPTGGSEE